MKNPFWESCLPPEVNRQAIHELRWQLAEKIDPPRWQTAREGLAAAVGCRASQLTIQDGVVRIGLPSDLLPEQEAGLDQALQAFVPWKKGPFEIFGRKIDSEWRSDLKWERMLPHVRSLEGELVADIGCHNGYFLYRMRELGVKAALGFEPMPLHAYNFALLQEFFPTPELGFELFGIEHIDLFPQSFDTIFCMGILYHHTDPVGLLRKMRKALKPKGRIFIDCQGIPGSDPLALVPAGRYAGAGGVWFLPTLSCLENWLKRAGFSSVERIFSAPLDPEEQRTTDWAPIKSLRDFLDPENPSLTKEGYPAPWRHYMLVKS